ncbi:HAMP domain-containing protein [Parasulfuritortus cantonensis]|uniref:histidine kinase n=1 Tax=Parasulfuritortus cantonensis TaxID=2528202 RepID=A0A4R1B4A4_9PROT|nr:ATP-binding protein [Parasulfuritortus cantonensis]TCJ12922.1 HAMP domain-containing protein [Parasulfuritortus cantonensis]
MLYLTLGSLLLGVSLVTLLSFSADNSGFFAEHFQILVWVAAVAALALAGLFGYQVYSLWRRVRAGVFGARLTARMFWIFGLMALLPGLVVYLLSVQFLVKSIESWFDVRMEQALESGLSLGQSALGHLENELVKKAEGMALQLLELPTSQQDDHLNELREAFGVQEVGLFDESGALIGFASSDKAAMVPRQPERAAIWQAKLQQPWSRTEQDSDGRTLIVRAAVPVNVVSLTENMRILQVAQPVSAKLSEDAQSVEAAHRSYQELAVSRLGLKRLYAVSLTLSLALSLFSALSLAYLLSERLAAPLRVLARGTRAVARGDYSQVNPINSGDELGMLTHSFNRMTLQLSEARAAAEENHDKLQEAKAYLESVLGSVSTGVVTLDADLRVQLVNPAAASILGCDRDTAEGRSLDDWCPADEGLRQFAATMAEHFRAAGRQAWREQVELAAPSGTRVLLARGTPLDAGEEAAYALALDDVTQLIQAQRDAAWGEVARRLAHEIKNPLTPIQLSAERLQLKLADQLPENGRAILVRATDTIVGQVAAMKSLVDAFAQYARTPAPSLQAMAVNPLVTDILALYEHHVPIDTALAPDLPEVSGDPSLLRQVLVNLIKNAEEALVERADQLIRVSSHRSPDGVTICVEDNGPGFPESLGNRLFEPYATTKPKGTGLGLAIVKKIIEEHHGGIEVRNLEPHGAAVCITLPIYVEIAAQDEPRSSPSREGPA